jgi:hypothetical protein
MTVGNFQNCDSYPDRIMKILYFYFKIIFEELRQFFFLIFILFSIHCDDEVVKVQVIGVRSHTSLLPQFCDRMDDAWKSF